MVGQVKALGEAKVEQADLEDACENKMTVLIVTNHLPCVILLVLTKGIYMILNDMIWHDMM